MIEQNQIPQEASRYHIPPFDKAGENPSLCSSKRPISLLSTYMKLLELIPARRITGVIETLLVDWRHAYQRKRSAEILLANLDSFVQDGSQRGQTVCLIGLDIQGEFDNADLSQVITAMEDIGAPKILARFMGNWMAVRTFRVRFMIPAGQYLSTPYMQSRGASQGRSPLPPLCG